MKRICALIFFILNGFAIQSQDNNKNIEMVSMTETYQSSYNSGGLYYKKGSKIPFTGVLYAKYDNGNLISKQEFVNGIGHGKWTDYDPLGNKKCEGTYKNNKIEGPVKFFYEDGSLQSEGQYLHWKQPIGLWKYYDKQGKLVHEMIYTK